jgi:hypothetical protein
VEVNWLRIALMGRMRRSLKDGKEPRDGKDGCTVGKALTLESKTKTSSGEVEAEERKKAMTCLRSEATARQATTCLRQRPSSTTFVKSTRWSGKDQGGQARTKFA